MQNSKTKCITLTFGFIGKVGQGESRSDRLFINFSLLYLKIHTSLYG